MVYGGGIWTVLVLVGFGFGYARVFYAPRWVYYVIIGLAVAIVAGSQLLPAGHLFKTSVYDDLVFLTWVIKIGIPVGIYALLVRLARKKALARDDP